MKKIEISTGLSLFGDLVDFDIHMQDLKLVLQKTEDIEFPEHEFANEGEALISDIFDQRQLFFPVNDN